ncbi:MAG: pilus assembly protein TadG-related protein [Actinomycetes bacterium]
MSGSRSRREAGQAALLLVGFFVVALLLAAVVVDASAAYLRRQGLDNVADGAALAGADGVQGREVYVGGLGERAQIDPAVAREHVAAYLRSTDAAARYPGLRWAVAADAERVVVRVAAPLDLPIPVPGVDRLPMISATGASYVVVSD